MTGHNIKVEQLLANGTVYRTFQLFATNLTLGPKLQRIAGAYDLKRTRVTVDGVVQKLVW